MPGVDPLLVVIVREAAVRSTLVARLAMSGADMWTGQDFYERRPASTRGAATVLITDQAALDGHPGGAAALLHDPQWRRVIVLTREMPAGSADPRLIHIEANDAAPAMVRLIEQWRRRA